MFYLIDDKRVHYEKLGQIKYFIVDTSKFKGKNELSNFSPKLINRTFCLYNDLIIKKKDIPNFYSTGICILF